MPAGRPGTWSATWWSGCPACSAAPPRITGAAIALYDACNWLQQQGRISLMPMRELVAAVSVGVIGGEPRLDLEYAEDVTAEDVSTVELADLRTAHESFFREWMED